MHLLILLAALLAAAVSEGATYKQVDRPLAIKIMRDNKTAKVWRCEEMQVVQSRHWTLAPKAIVPANHKR